MHIALASSTPLPWGLVAIAEPGPDCGSGVWLQLLEPDWTCAGGPAPLWPTDGVAVFDTGILVAGLSTDLWFAEVKW